MVWSSGRSAGFSGDTGGWESSDGSCWARTPLRLHDASAGLLAEGGGARAEARRALQCFTFALPPEISSEQRGSEVKNQFVSSCHRLRPCEGVWGNRNCMGVQIGQVGTRFGDRSNLPNWVI